MSWGLAKKIEISKVGVIILRFLPRNSYKAYDQHALNNQKNFKIGQKKKLCEMSLGPLFKVHERLLKIFMFKSFNGGLNKNELLSVCSAF